MAYYGIMRYHDKRIYKDTSVIVSDDCDIYSRRILNHPPLSNHGPKKFRRWILLKSNRLSDSQLFLQYVVLPVGILLLNISQHHVHQIGGTWSLHLRSRDAGFAAEMIVLNDRLYLFFTDLTCNISSSSNLVWFLAIFGFCLLIWSRSIEMFDLNGAAAAKQGAETHEVCEW